MIRPASIAHAKVMEAIHADCFIGAEAWSNDAFEALLRFGGVAGLLHEPDGFVLWRQAVDEADVVTLAVQSDARRHGIGRALVGHATQALRARGVGLVFLEVGSENQAALALYESVGFEQIGMRPAYYPDGSAALAMRLALP